MKIYCRLMNKRWKNEDKRVLLGPGRPLICFRVQTKNVPKCFIGVSKVSTYILMIFIYFLEILIIL